MRSSITNVVSLAQKVKDESQYWSGYDIKLIENMYKEALTLENDIQSLKRKADEQRASTRSVLLFILCVLLGIGTIAFFVERNASKYENLKSNLTDDIRTELLTDMPKLAKDAGLDKQIREDLIKDLPKVAKEAGYIALENDYYTIFIKTKYRGDENVTK
jgi:hypothetical protein